VHRKERIFESCDWFLKEASLRRDNTGEGVSQRTEGLHPDLAVSSGCATGHPGCRYHP
jgi:hypothetical protein